MTREPCRELKATPQQAAGLHRVGSGRFYSRFGKRAFDIVVSVLVLALLSPLFVICAILIIADSPGSVLFRQLRVGRQGRLFTILKFRTMRNQGQISGPSVTASGDPRVTAVGAWLRSSKLDELPQFWNVLKGEMSLVGPRPELQKYVQVYTPDQRVVLDVRPGLTDPASIAYRDEEALLGSKSDPETFYREQVMSRKLEMSGEYVRRVSFLGDISLLLATAAAIFGFRKAQERIP